MSVTQEAKPRILVLEDNYLTADELCELVRDCGCDVAGAMGRVDSAITFLEDREIDGAIVDVNLHGDPSFPVCQELKRRRVPFLFVSGYGPAVIPDAFRESPLLSKPIDQHDLRAALADFTRISFLHSRQRKPLGNALLDSLPLVAFEALRGRLERASLRVGQIVQAARQPMAQVYFPSEGLISLMARGARGRRIEVGQVGSEGMIGATAILDDRVVSAIEAVVQLPTEAWQIAVKDLMPLVRSDRLLRGELLRYVQALIGQIAQTTLATGHAKIEQRVARWLLMAATRCRTSRLEVTHEHLSQVLAVRRSGITVALHMLEARQVIKSHRKLVEILDYAGLRREADDFLGPSEEAASAVR